jgi:hypothetical protein
MSVPVPDDRCTATNQEGTRCRLRSLPGGLCRYHAPVALGDGRCWALTAAGTSCRHPEIGPNHLCVQHEPWCAEIAAWLAGDPGDWRATSAPFDADRASLERERRA